jgi:acetyl esterase/lipase
VGVVAIMLAACVMPDPKPAEQLTPAQWTVAADYTVTSVAYGNQPAQTLDLYRPAGLGGANPPVLVYLHGGGWTGGTKAEVRDATLGRSVFAQLRRGFVVVSVDYRLAFTDPFPAALLDAKAAVRWLHGQPDYASSPIVVAGSSAGGNLAVMVAVTSGVTALEPGGRGRTDVQGAVSLDGPIELRAMLQEPWLTFTWYGVHTPGTEQFTHFGESLQTGELVPAYLGCADAQVTDGRLTPQCQALVDRRIDQASAASHLDDADPPLYLVCVAPPVDPRARTFVPDCDHDHAIFAERYRRAHHDRPGAVWVDRLDQPAANHGTVDANLNFKALNQYLDTVTPATPVD